MSLVARVCRFAVTSIVLTACEAAPGAELPDVIAAVKPSIVGIGTVQWTRRPPVHLVGTGFVVADGRHVLTNMHNLPDRLDLERKEFLAVMVAGGQKGEARQAEVVETDAEHDVALLRMKGSALPAVSIGRSKDVREGEVYAFTGFPIGMVLGMRPVTHRGMISAITPIIIPQLSSRQLTAKAIKRLRSPFEVFQLDATAYPGNSGSPLYHPETGAVVGIVNMVFVKESKETVLEKPSGISYAIPIEHARALLARAGLSP